MTDEEIRGALWHAARNVYMLEKRYRENPSEGTARLIEYWLGRMAAYEEVLNIYMVVWYTPYNWD